MSAYAADNGQMSRRTVVFFAITVLHFFIGWAFVSGFGKSVVAKVFKDVEIEQVEELEKDEPPPPPPKVELNLPPPVAMPPPLVTIDVPVDVPVVKTEIYVPPPPAPRAAVPGTALELVRPPAVDSFYPDNAKRNEEEGSANIRLCVLPDGSFEGAPELTQTSGNADLDQGAMAWGKAVQLRKARPATVDGRAVRACKAFKVTFKIKK